MEAKWYYSENGKALGPMSAKEIAGRIRQAKNESHFVWIEGMSDWTDASTVPEFSAALQAPGTALASGAEAGAGTKGASAAEQATLVQRARRELYEYLVVSAYLYVCFAALIFYKASILRGEGIEFTAFGLAIVKALILGKFLLLLEAFKIGEDKKHARSALANILTKSLLFSLLLFAMTVVEELIVGHFHGRESREVLREIAGGTWQQALAIAILLFLILIPFFGYQEVAARLGKGKLSKLLTERPPPEGRE
jgi:GYF domain 2